MACQNLCGARQPVVPPIFRQRFRSGKLPSVGVVRGVDQLTGTTLDREPTMPLAKLDADGEAAGARVTVDGDCRPENGGA